MTSSSRIRELARKVSATAEQLASYLESNNLQEPKFGPETLDVPFSKEYVELGFAVREASNELQALVAGPKNLMRQLTFTQFELAALQAAVQLGMFTAVPASGSITLEELAKKINLDPDRTGSIMRMLATRYIFTEIEPDAFAQTSASNLVATDENIHAFIEFMQSDCFQACGETAKCLKSFPGPHDMTHTPVSTRFGVPLWTLLEETPESARRFGKGMAGLAKSECVC